MLESRMVRTQGFCRGAAALLVLAATTPAHAQLWLELRAGPTLASGNFEYETPYTTETGEPSAIRGHDGFIGVGLAIDGIAGLPIGSELGVGLLGHVEFAHYVEAVNLEYDTVRDHLLVGIGPTLALRPGRSMKLGASLEYVYAALATSGIDLGAVDNVYVPENPSGVGASLSLACCAEPGFGFAMAGRAAWLSGNHTVFIPVTFAVLATYSTW